MHPRAGIVFLCMTEVILCASEAARNWPHSTHPKHYHPQQRADLHSRRYQIPSPNPFLRPRLSIPGTQNVPQSWPHNRHKLQYLPRQDFHIHGMNLTRAQNRPHNWQMMQVLPNITQKIQTLPNYDPKVQILPKNQHKIQVLPNNLPNIQHLPSHTYQRTQVPNYKHFNKSDVLRMQESPTVKHLSTVLQSTPSKTLPSTRNNVKHLESQNITLRLTKLSTPERIGKQWVLPRTLVGAYRTTQRNTRRRWWRRGRTNTTRPSCPDGKVWRRGQCVCPYLSNWDENEGKCICIYGTYKDSNGNCRNF
nr:uncharacterized protein LOC128691178 isoform X1 [Cherax quadricarinatus]